LRSAAHECGIACDSAKNSRSPPEEIGGDFPSKQMFCFSLADILTYMDILSGSVERITFYNLENG
jgi:hypothetical protein